MNLFIMNIKQVSIIDTENLNLVLNLKEMLFIYAKLTNQFIVYLKHILFEIDGNCTCN